MKYIFVTGGVVSGLGKGICAASLGRLLKQGGLDIPQDIASYDALLAAVLRAKGGGRP